MDTRTTVIGLHRLGPQEYLVVLACGHRYVVPVTDLTRLRLFIGKRVTCWECHDRREAHVSKLMFLNAGAGSLGEPGRDGGLCYLASIGQSWERAQKNRPPQTKVG
jgi:hypothetical protein